MFRPRRDFNGRVFHDIRREAILHDQGAHLAALSLLRDTIERINAPLKSSSGSHQKDGGATGAGDVIDPAAEIRATQRGLRIVQSATEKKQFASQQQQQQHSRQSHGKVRRGRDGEVEKNDDDQNGDDEEDLDAPEFDRSRLLQEAEIRFQELQRFVLLHSSSAVQMSVFATSSSSSAAADGGAEGDESVLDALVSVL